MSDLLRVVLVLGLALAFVTAAFSHKVPSTSDLRLQAYILDGGSADDLCGDTEGEGGKQDCLFCTLTAGCMAPAPAALLGDADLRLMAEIVMPALAYSARNARDPARPSQGPPTA